MTQSVINWNVPRSLKQRLTAWRLIPGEIGSQGISGPFARYVQFPIEDTLEITFEQQFGSGTETYTFVTDNFVWRGCGRMFNIMKFIDRMEIMMGTPFDPKKHGASVPVIYNRKYKFTLQQIRSQP